MSYLSEALYTQQLQTAYDTDPTIITSTIVLDTPAHSQKLQEMIMDKYALWEIQGETIAEEKLLLKILRTTKSQRIWQMPLSPRTPIRSKMQQQNWNLPS